MHSLWLLAFSIASGFTASAIVANVYRICRAAKSGVKEEAFGERALRSAVLVFAGPSMLFDNAMRGFRGKTWHPVSFWLATAGVLYWSLALGLLVIEVAIRL
jgi:uncharacterized protein DUF6949